MSLLRQVASRLPAGLRARIRRVLGPNSHSGEFRLSRERREAAISRFSSIDWHEAAPHRLIYALTPTADLRNIGDHAQVVAITRWLNRHYPGWPVIELDKDVSIASIDSIVTRVRPDDIIFLHSGGNLGDRGRWSETGRRLLIQHLSRNRIISLPQTIYFSDTPAGAREREISRSIYNRHPDLTIFGRDRVSGELAAELFPEARTGTAPDFVLSLDASAFGIDDDLGLTGDVLACLRLDNESALGENGRGELLARIGRSTTHFDTTLDKPIPPDRRAQILAETLRLFASHRTIVTDRYHGLIFGVLCRKPVVVLPTVDHKLTSAIEWFSDLPNIVFCEDHAEVPEALVRAEAASVMAYPDFNRLHFDPLARSLQAPGQRG